MTTSEAAPPPPGELDGELDAPAPPQLASLPADAPEGPGAPGDRRAPPVRPLEPLAKPEGAPGKRPSITLLVVVTVVSLAADLASKGWAKSHLAGYDLK